MVTKTKVRKGNRSHTVKKSNSQKQKKPVKTLDKMFMDTFQKGGEVLKTQSGGGYFIDLSVNIGNRPGVVGYSDNTPPIFINGQAIFGEGVNPVCGQQTGGTRKVSKKSNSRRKYFRSNKRQHGGAEGLSSNFSADMSTRQFDCKQGDWTPDCI